VLANGTSLCTDSSSAGRSAGPQVAFCRSFCRILARFGADSRGLVTACAVDSHTASTFLAVHTLRRHIPKPSNTQDVKKIAASPCPQQHKSPPANISVLNIKYFIHIYSTRSRAIGEDKNIKFCFSPGDTT